MTEDEFNRGCARVRLKYSQERLDEINRMNEPARAIARAEYWRLIQAAAELLREPPGRFFLLNPFEETAQNDRNYR